MTPILRIKLIALVIRLKTLSPIHHCAPPWSCVGWRPDASRESETY